MQTMALRQALVTRLGRFPERVPLTPTVGWRIDEGASTRALITYGVEAGEKVSAWLLMPQGAAPPGGWPAVLAIHQHANQYDLGKAEPAGLSGNSIHSLTVPLHPAYFFSSFQHSLAISQSSRV